MTRFSCSLLVFLCCYWVLEASFFEAEEKPKKKCVLTKSRLMLAADCHRLDLTVIPDDLDPAIQIMDVSFNRLRGLPCNAFSTYQSLSMLYLYDNLLTNLEDGVFMDLQKLEVLDISLNGLQTIPIDVVSLPKIRKLYLDRNHLGTKGFQVMQDTEIKSSLKYLSTAYCGLQDLPPLHAFPELTFLNVSGNNIRTIHPEQLAPACHLELLDLNHNEHLFKDNDCNCQILQSYLQEKKIKLVPPFQLKCDTMLVDLRESENECGNSSSVSAETQAIYSSCKNEKMSKMHEAQVRKAWVIAASTVASVLVVVLVVLYCVRRRNRHRDQKRRKADAAQNNNLNRPSNPDGAENDQQSNLLEDRGFNITNIQNM